MPKLSPLQWLIVALFQAFYGFAVFAVTRDYYHRHPIVPRAGAPGGSTAAPAAGSQRVPAGGLTETLGSDSAIPESLVRQDPVLLAQLGDERFAQRQFQEAIRIYRKVLEMKPEDVDTHNDLGLALHYAGDSEQALRVLKEGVEQDPKFQRIWLTLGFVQTQTAEKPEAEFALREAIKLDPDSDIAKEAKRLLSRLGQP
jgi:tetratricopeptide (TPR) repeat protein